MFLRGIFTVEGTIAGRVSILGLAVATLTLASRPTTATENPPTQLPAAATAKIDFERDVQPIFQRTCYSCHGPEKQEAGLRLDDRQRAFEGGDSGKAFQAGKSADSRIIVRVAGIDEAEGLMPPEGEGTPLTAEQVGILRAWIDQGAHWPETATGNKAATDLWSLKPVASPRPPTVSDPTWVQSPVDAFILARLDQDKIVPSPPADRETLLRRLHFDLLGLPPTPVEVEQFLADERPDAYEQLVDRLLSSPHYGERWGRHWLDVARYADSDGYEKDRPRPFAWRYREWVLDAINADMPFDQFTIAQLAGDLLPDATLDHRVASGFHRNTLHNTEGGADPEEDRVKKTVDRTNTLGAAWLGLTVGCAQCHSHKYDPLTQREYYQLYSFFNDIEETDIPAPLPVEQLKYAAARAEFDRRHEPVVAALRKYEQEQLPAAQAAWEQTATATVVTWSALVPEKATSKHGADLKRQPDESLLATGTNKDSDVYVIESSAPLKTIRALRIEVLPDDSLPAKGPGRSKNGNFVLASLQVETLDKDKGQSHPFRRAQADFSQSTCDVAHAINDNPADFWAVAPKFGERHVAVFEFEQPLALENGQLRITLDQKYGKNNQPHNLGRFRLSVTDTDAPLTLEGWPAEVAAAIALEPARRSADQQRQVTEFFRSQDPEWLRLNKAVEDHLKKAPQPPATKAQAIAQRSEPRETHIHIRGDFLSPGDVVTAGTPSFLPPAEARGEKLDRLDLARWVVSEENPLTPRVQVNRVWERIFGRGIVPTIDDFGKQGDAPSHPELLDWLADDFRAHGWSVKHVVRQIVLSSTYRQSSATRTELEQVDPENILLARQQRRRVEAEVIRDAALVASGLLDTRVGGPSVRPPQPAEYANLTYANSAKWVESRGGDKYRRGLYTFFQRTSPYPMLMTFDSPDSNECCVQRDSSNTPLQALTLWNDPVFFECAQAFGRRLVAEVPPQSATEATTGQRAEQAFLICLARRPVAAEVSEVIRLYEAELALLQDQSELAEKICGSAPRPGETSAAELASWIVVGRTLMNLDEFIMRE